MSDLRDYNELLSLLAGIRHRNINDGKMSLEMVEGHLDRVIESLWLEVKSNDDLVEYGIMIMSTQYNNLINPELYTDAPAIGDYVNPSVGKDCYINEFMFIG